jgi:hypothetical protein
MQLGYYRVLVIDPDDEDDDRFQEGDIVFVSRIDGKGVHWTMIDDTDDYDGVSSFVTHDVDDFMSRHEFEPDGNKIRAQQIEELMGEIQQMNAENVQLGIDAQDSVKLLGVGSVGSEVGTSNALIPAKRPEAIKKKMAALQATMKKKSTAIMLKQKKMQALMNEQTSALSSVTRVFEKVTERLNETMWSINLYLGRDEQIAQIQEGEPADPETPISIRQMTLFMDEESAMNADFGGLEFEDIPKFDEWVVKPENLNRLIPEPRCVVAIKPRREIKKSADMDPYEQQARAEVELKTYFLIRNGESVFRVCTELEVGENLFPFKNEFDDYFYRGDEPLKPGSARYNKAMEAADSAQRHYMRVVLFLQGLIDRTTVFAPLPGGHLNICDPRSQQENLRFVRDMEMVITDGRPTFSEWLKDLNSQLKVGHRVVGAWNSWGSRDQTRTWPKYAQGVDSYTIQVIEKSEKGEFGFGFEQEKRHVRNKDFWGPKWEYRKPEKRGSFRFSRSGKFFVNFDLVNPDDIEYYLNDRLSRHEYLKLFPLLTRVRDMKRKEAEQEAPFRRLLTTTIRDTYNLEQHEAERLVNVLVSWYKFKNKVHRSLKKNEKKAMKMIVAEAGLRLDRDKERERKLADAVEIVNLLDGDKVIYIGHVKGNEYVKVEAANDEKIFVHETHANVRRIKGKMTVTIRERREWRVSNPNRERWHALHATPTWEEWNHNARAREHLTGPEIEQVIADIVKETPKIKDARSGHGRTRKKLANVRNLLANAKSLGKVPAIAFLYEAQNDEPEYIRVYFLASCGFVPENLLTGPSWYTPRVKYVDAQWKRVHGKFKYTFDWHGASGGYDNLDTALGWARGKEIWRSTDNYTKIQGLYKIYNDLKAKASELRNPIRGLWTELDKAMDKQELDKAYAEFIQEFGEEAAELWEDQKKRIRVGEDRDTREIHSFLEFLAEKRINPRGMTIKEVIAKCAEMGVVEWEDEGYDWDSATGDYVDLGKMVPPSQKKIDKLLATHPADYRFPLEDEEPEDDEELLVDSEDDEEGDQDEYVQEVQEQAQKLVSTVLDGLRGIMNA